MERVKRLSPFLSVSPQITEADLAILAAEGFEAVISNRPDAEEIGQASADQLAEAAARHGLAFRHIPVVPGKIGDEDIQAFEAALEELKGPVLAFCRTGTRSATLWALSEARHLNPESILATTAEAGYRLDALRPKLEARFAADAQATPGRRAPTPVQEPFDVVIVGGGAAGLATAASLLKRRHGLKIAVIEPSEHHYYQPGWTLIGAGCFDRRRAERAMADVMPKGVQWIRAAAAGFEPERNAVVLEDGERIAYRTLVAAPGLELHWAGVEGLEETLGKNGVTSNYRFGLAPYTWELVQSLDGGRALFTQPAMPIKCAGAPQKAMYLSCDHWRRRGVLGDIEVEFHNTGGVLFGVKEFVPPLMKYVEGYGAHLAFSSTLKAVDGAAQKAYFEQADGDGGLRTVERDFDMLHVCPPQRAPAIVRESPLADEAGWIAVSPETLQHQRYGNVFGLGDGCSTPNAKTAAAVRKQAPVVAVNVLSVLDGKPPQAVYDGYGSCPLTVERGRVVLAEFGYGGKLLPTFPVDPTRARWSAWALKAHLMPWIYFSLMLRGHEWFAGPKVLPYAPPAQDRPPQKDTPDGQKAKAA